MPKGEFKAVKDLALDLKNFRTPEQTSELGAVRAMLAVNRKGFWEITESLLDDGYLAGENILVLKRGKEHVVKEGNQRVASIKLILGLISSSTIDIPADIEGKIKSLRKDIEVSLEKVPCQIYSTSESDILDKIVARTHAKGQKAGRTDWNAVATARHHRDQQAGTEPGLDLLERYLKVGKNLSRNEKAEWGGAYPLSVLNEAIAKLVQRMEFKTAADLVAAYPSKLGKAAYRAGIESLLHDIGRKALGFARLRADKPDFAAAYGLPTLSQKRAGRGGTGNGKGTGKTTTKKKAKPTSASRRDPKSVKKRLRDMPIRGPKREKVVDLRDEAVALDLRKTPLAFCFLLRSMFEISAKAFCADHKAAGLSVKDAKGSDKPLVRVLQEAAKHLVAAANDKTEMKRRLHGATAELARPSSILSVTSMNQLVHNPDFSVNPADVSGMFNNVAALLEAMNE